ncbi:phosphopantothenoylcysteine decarboxylase [Roseibacillus ishigakijimensis]|uniref:Phosphopantothenoylcysteine decarboxylase n=1 Tax=Roseibacillus ishigakijimensis TaxID=454146 RepID=A0A934RN53_9BACT|nr:phosphopantothenoylcysteine decarboxylase [Roseibacillus ishigakijimensis]MBK1832436.1 phosphopantothenoylcysteine decarboxylase [Roseibacillus ishigakijimensis]
MTILITAGPTREAIDPVRYLTNRSSGKMGYALAEAAARKGHRVILISGPTTIEVPDGIDFIPVESAADMHQAVKHWIGKAQVALFAAAVADYRPARVEEQKIKKTGDTLTLELVRTPDILGSARAEFGFTGYLVGFAAETEKVEENALAKLERKGCDLVIANDVSRSDIGFDSRENEVTLLFRDRVMPLEKASKEHLGHEIIAILEEESQLS